MSRIRTIKPDFYKNESLSALPEVTHYGMAAGLLTYADDEGYFNANPGLIKAEIFPLREPSVPIPEMLDQLAGIDFIRLIDGPDGRKYGHVVKFAEHQRVSHPAESKIRKILRYRKPREDSGNPPDDSGASPEDVGKPPEPLRPEGKGKEGKGKEGKGSAQLAIETASEGDEILPGIDSAAWHCWLDYRKKIRKPLKPVSILAAQRELAAFGCEQMAVVQQSIANGYQGLFPLKNKGNGKSTGRKTLADYQPDLREAHEPIAGTSRRVE